MVRRKQMNESEHYEQLFETYILLRLCAACTLVVRREELHKQGISITRFAILYAIKSYGGSATISEIAKRLFHRRNTVKELIDRMNRDGLVSRTKGCDSSDRRLVTVTLTPKGEKMFNRGRRSKVIIRIMSVLTNSQLEQVSKLLRLIMSETSQETNVS